MIVRQYRVEVKEEPQFASETFEQRKERLLANMPGVTMTSVHLLAGAMFGTNGLFLQAHSHAVGVQASTLTLNLHYL